MADHEPQGGHRHRRTPTGRPLGSGRTGRAP